MRRIVAEIAACGIATLLLVADPFRMAGLYGFRYPWIALVSVVVFLSYPLAVRQGCHRPIRLASYLGGSVWLLLAHAISFTVYVFRGDEYVWLDMSIPFALSEVMTSAVSVALCFGVVVLVKRCRSQDRVDNEK